jgi:hypothetical protein
MEAFMFISKRDCYWYFYYSNHNSHRQKISLNTKSRLDAQRFPEKYKEAEENCRLNLQPPAEVVGERERRTPLFSELKKIVLEYVHANYSPRTAKLDDSILRYFINLMDGFLPKVISSQQLI